MGALTYTDTFTHSDSQLFIWTWREYQIFLF
jgi:hypothetical protein